MSSDEYLNYAIKNREEWTRKGEAVTAEMVAKARDKDLARMEKQASMRRPIITEMKVAVKTMRSPQIKQDMYKQASFRHLRVEPMVSESVSHNTGGFARQPPIRARPNQSVSMGAVELGAMKQVRKMRPGLSSRVSRPPATADEEAGAAKTPENPPEADSDDQPATGIGVKRPEADSDDQPATGEGLKRPQRKASIAF